MEAKLQFINRLSSVIIFLLRLLITPTCGIKLCRTDDWGVHGNRSGGLHGFVLQGGDVVIAGGRDVELCDSGTFLLLLLFLLFSPVPSFSRLFVVPRFVVLVAT